MPIALCSTPARAAVLAALAVVCGGCVAQLPPTKLDAATRAATIAQVNKTLRESYVFPAAASTAAAELESQLKSGAYDRCQTPDEFGRAVTADLQRVAGDRHLSLLVGAAGTAAQGPATQPADRDRAAAIENYGFVRAAHLAGNIGYIRIDGFVHPTGRAFEVAASAMNFVAGADAVIFDLRENGGGNALMVQFVLSYLFDPDPPVLLNTVYDRDDNAETQYWTLAQVPGVRFPRTPVYILTSRRTFSAAEAFCDDLQSRRRAIIIGETTGGGANPGRAHRINDVFTLFVPSGRVTNPVTHSNWEGRGVAPDVPSPADRALSLAHVRALKDLLAGGDAADAQRWQWAMPEAAAAESSVQLTAAERQRLTGRYGPYRVSLDSEQLSCQKDGDAAARLEPLTPTLMRIVGDPRRRLEFEVDRGKTLRLIERTESGGSAVFDRTITAEDSAKAPVR